MRKISNKIKNNILNDNFYSTCARAMDGGCKGRITWEHSIIFAGRQLDEKWAIIPLCAYHHAVDEYQDGGNLDKDKNMWIALNRATDDELKAISKSCDYIFTRKRLNEYYGDYNPGRRDSQEKF